MAYTDYLQLAASSVVTALKANTDLYTGDGKTGLVKKIELGLITPFESDEVTAADCDYISVSIPGDHADIEHGTTHAIDFGIIVRCSVLVMANPQLVAEHKMRSILAQIKQVFVNQKVTRPFGIGDDFGRATLVHVGESHFEDFKKAGQVWQISGSHTSVIQYQLFQPTS